MATRAMAYLPTSAITPSGFRCTEATGARRYFAILGVSWCPEIGLNRMTAKHKFGRVGPYILLRV